MGGRIVGFGSDLTIPVLVSPRSVIIFIVENAELIVNVEISPSTQKGTPLFAIFICFFRKMLIILSRYTKDYSGIQPLFSLVVNNSGVVSCNTTSFPLLFPHLAVSLFFSLVLPLFYIFI
jgi:hypothetical protein